MPPRTPHFVRLCGEDPLKYPWTAIGQQPTVCQPLIYIKKFLLRAVTKLSLTDHKLPVLLLFINVAMLHRSQLVMFQIWLVYTRNFF